MENKDALQKKIRQELEALPQEALLEELIKWRLAVPNIARMTRELSLFKQFAADAGELTIKINRLDQVHRAELEKLAEELKQLRMVLQSYADDPLGIGHKIEQMANVATKIH
jgi:hypothetical protein